MSKSAAKKKKCKKSKNNGSRKRGSSRRSASGDKAWKPPTGKELRQLQEDWDHVT